MKTRAHVGGFGSLGSEKRRLLPSPLRIGTLGFASFQTDKGRRN
jgi:hypothetical protein